MKILLVCKSLPNTFKGGIQTHVWKLSEWLIKLGNEVHILAGGSYKASEKKYIDGGRIIHEVPFFPGRKLPVIPIFAEEYAFNLAAAKWLNRHAAQFDIIHLQGRSGYLFDWRHQHKTPLVVTLHGLIDVEYAQSNKKSSTMLDRSIHQKRTKQFEAKQFQRADALICVSNEMQRLAQRQYPQHSEKMHIIYNGIDAPNFAPEPWQENSNILLFVGRLSSIKGIFPLVQAMKNVRSDIELVLVGDGPDRESLEQEIRKLGIQDRIRFTGSLHSEEVYAWIQKSYTLILPSFYETQGIVLMEANICGRPVLASNIHGIDEVVESGKNGLLFEKGNPDSIAKSINWLFDHPAEAERMGNFGATYILEKFAWEQIAYDTIELYEELASTPLKTPAL
ncbi:MAG: glycosyltransferase family 4 protein [Saprospiraceae bacterium]|nr:glycosyltransferase family 4 protein [Saprospiraceae bacterium]